MKPGVRMPPRRVDLERALGHLELRADRLDRVADDEHVGVLEHAGASRR